VISPDEAKCRKSVEIAIADSRIEGYPPLGPAEQAILDAFIRGEIKAEDLVEVYKRKLLHLPSRGALEDGLK
jgi:hypothetical protein